LGSKKRGKKKDGAPQGKRPINLPIHRPRQHGGYEGEKTKKKEKNKVGGGKMLKTSGKRGGEGAEELTDSVFSPGLKGTSLSGFGMEQEGTKTLVSEIPSRGSSPVGLADDGEGKTKIE